MSNQYFKNPKEDLEYDDVDNHCNDMSYLQTLQGLPGGALSAKGDLRTSIKSLQTCSITPGRYMYI